MIITLVKTEGSTPRELGAWMAVTAHEVTGTIGGGRLEFDAILSARGMLTNRDTSKTIDVTLGPAIGQCCGGRVTLTVVLADHDLVHSLAEKEAVAVSDQHSVCIYGAGHVGRALARALAPLPFHTRLIDSRAEELARTQGSGFEQVLTDTPVSLAEQAPEGTAHVIMTHSHALDSLLAAAILERNCFGYLGIIGSRTKRASFRSAFRAMGFAKDRIDRVVCPIGGNDVNDKRPEVIAAMTAAEITRVLLRSPARLAITPLL
jgi:xanthine dehydrogenase accessory factor